MSSWELLRRTNGTNEKPLNGTRWVNQGDLRGLVITTKPQLTRKQYFPVQYDQIDYTRFNYKGVDVKYVASALPQILRIEDIGSSHISKEAIKVTTTLIEYAQSIVIITYRSLVCIASTSYNVCEVPKYADPRVS